LGKDTNSFWKFGKKIEDFFCS